MKNYLAFIAALVFCVVATSSCTRHTTCSAYGTSIKTMEVDQDEVHASVIEIETENI